MNMLLGCPKRVWCRIRGVSQQVKTVILFCKCGKSGVDLCDKTEKLAKEYIEKLTPLILITFSM